MNQQPQPGVLVNGPGTGTSDSIPAALSDGELVIPAEDVRSFGAAQIMAMVKDAGKKLPKPKVHEGVQHAATGGLIEDPMAPGAVTRVGNDYSGGNVTGAINVNGAAPGGTVSSIATPAPLATPTAQPAAVPAAPGPLPSTGLSVFAAPAPNQTVRSAFAPPAAGAQGMATGGQTSWSGRAPAAQPMGGSAQAAPARRPAPAMPAAGPLVPENRLGFATGGLVDAEEARRRLGVMPEGQSSGGAAFGLYPQLAGDARTHGLANRLRQGVTAAGAEGTAQTFQPAMPLAATVAAPRLTGARLNAETDPRSLAYTGATPDAAPLATPPAAQVMAAPTAAPLGDGTRLGLVGAAGVTSADRVAGMERSAEASRGLAARAMERTQQGWDGPTPGMGLIGPADYANRNADFNDGAAMRTAAARGSWSPRGGFRSDDGAIQAASIPLAQRAQQRIESEQQAGAMARTQMQEQGLNARERMAALQRGEANDIGRARLGIEAFKATTDAAAKNKEAGKLTEDQGKSAGYAVRMENSLRLMNDIGKTNPGATRPGVGTALLNSLPETAANMLRPEARQRVEAAQLDALDAALTLNTGAAYTREQLQGMSRSYFAQPGDNDQTVAEKQQRLSSLIDSARLRAGPSGNAMADTAVQKAQSARQAANPAAAAVPDDVAALLKKYGG